MTLICLSVYLKEIIGNKSNKLKKTSIEVVARNLYKGEKRKKERKKGNCGYIKAFYYLELAYYMIERDYITKAVI